MKDLWRSGADRQDGVLLDEALFNRVSPAGVEVAERRGRGRRSSRGAGPLDVKMAGEAAEHFCVFLS